MEVLQIWERNLETKKDIRKKILQKRRDCPDFLIRKWTGQIEKRVFIHPFFMEAEDICVYLSFDKEVGTEGIIERAVKLGKRIWVPKISGKEMNFQLFDPKIPLIRNRYGILEPEKDGLFFQERKQTRSLVIMPGVAFDSRRNRIGYGGGYYDRYLDGKKTFWTMALAFELQVVEMLPAENTDIRPDVLITEKRSC